MKRMKLINLLLFTILLLTSISGDAETLSIDQAIEQALASNIDLLKTSYTVNSALVELQNSWNIFFPSFSAGIGLSQNSGFLVFGGNPTYSQNMENPWSFSASLSMQIPLSLSSVQEVKQRELGFQSAQLNQDELSAQIIRSVEKAYYGIQTFLKDLEIKKKNLSLVQARFESVRQKYNSGLSSDLDLLKAEISVEEARLPYQRSLAEYQKNINIFKRMIGIDFEKSIELVTPMEIQPVEISPEEWIEKRLHSRFDMRKIQLAIILAEYRQAQNSISSFVPSLSASSSLRTGVSEAFSADSWNPESLSANWSLSFSMSIPLNAYIPGSKGHLALQSEEVSMKKLLLDYEKTQFTAEDEIKSYARDLSIIQANLALSGKLKTLSQRNYDAVQESYNVGESTLLEVEDAQQSLLSAQLSQLNTQYQYLSTLIDLGYALNTNWHDF